MNFFSGKKISEENKNLLEICKSKEKAIDMLTELTQTLKSENTEMNKQLTEQLHIVDDLTATNNHISALYEKLKEKYKKLEDEKDIVSVNELTFMNDNLRKERDELLIDKDKLINELAIYKSMFGHIQDIVKDYGNAILEVKKFKPEQKDCCEDDKKIEYVKDLADINETELYVDHGIHNINNVTGVCYTNTSYDDSNVDKKSELVEIRKIRKISKSNFDILDCVDKRTVYIIVQNEDEEETVCFDEPTFAKIIKSYCDAKEDSLEEVTNPILDGPYSDVW